MNIKNHSCIIYLIGKPGTGKYTIAKELAKVGYIICDNQLINNPIFSLLNYDGFTKIPKSAWEAIGHIRKAVFNFLSVEKINSYVLTNSLYEDEGDCKLYKQVESMALKRSSIFVPVKLLISEKEHVKRITKAKRLLRLKSIDPEYVYLKKPLISIENKNLLELDVSNLPATKAAEIILDHISAVRAENH